MTRRGRPPADDVLTPGEWRVLEAVRHGLTNPQIAQRQGISVDAVKYHVANALQKLGFRRRSELRLWDGIARRSPLHQRGIPMQTSTTLSALGQISRSVRNIGEAQAWYRDVLGLTHLYSFGNLALVDCDGARLFLAEGEEATNDSILFFKVSGIHAVCRALVQRGAEFVNAPDLIHRHDDGSEEWMAFFKDNEGRPLAVMERVAVGGGAAERGGA
jgi:DNA-binding CsgD family transcriptional regulator